MREVPALSERFAIAACRSRWLEGFELEHPVLCPIRSVAREADSLIVFREVPRGRRLGEGRVPRPCRPALLLQAAAAIGFFASRGFPYSADELDDAVWDVFAGTPRLWIPRAPRSLQAPEETPASEALAVVVLRVSAPAGRPSGPGARAVLARLSEPEAARRRGEQWTAVVLRAFPELALPAASGARERVVGISGEALRAVRSRALGREASARIAGRSPRIFAATGSGITPGEALGLSPPPRSIADGAARLRRLGSEAPDQTWIAIEPERWDSLSLRAFDAAALALGDRVEVARVSEREPPGSPAEWRRALWIPCAAPAASVRLWETMAARAPGWPGGGAALAREIVRSRGWAAFASDPTGDAPLPIGDPAPAPAVSRTRPEDPAGRIEHWIDTGRTQDAFAEAELWVRSRPDLAPEAWFPLAARLRGAAAGVAAPWLDGIEAEREIAGGRPADARERLEHVLRSAEADPSLRRRTALRLAEVAVLQGRHVEAARRAAIWRREHPEAPPAETVRALRLGAAGLSREGRADCALALLDEAERIGEGLPIPDRVETALCRARVLARAGRFEEEDRIYETLREIVSASNDERVSVRFLAQEGRALLDRRQAARAVLRFEEARELASDPSERAELLLDLAAAVYHAGGEEREARCEAFLEEALGAAAAAGREDLARGARGNRIELLVNRGAWAAAAAEIASLEASARAERDEPRRLIALHHESRLALRRGFLEEAGRANAEARALAARLSDRLEIGELWLEEGDRLACSGDREGARAAWTAASEDPPDRCRSDATARRRLEELAWGDAADPPEEAWRRLDALFASDPYRAAETAARWTALWGSGAVPEPIRLRASATLRAGGGEELARRVFGAAAGMPADALRPLRDAVSAALSGAEPALDDALDRLGITGLAVRDPEGRELVRLAPGPVPETADWRELDAGSARFSLALWPRPAPEISSAVSLLLETLLFRPAAPRAAEAGDYEEGWARLGVTASDVSMEEPYRRLVRFAPQPVSVLLLGESGSGKEAVARAVHRLSARASGPFVAVNVPAVAPALIESELFGHARGAFTGADRDRKGLMEEAAGGTLFLDEIGDLALPLQSKLLRALQEREIRRVGENRPRPIDVRVVSATSRDLSAEIEAGRFREDLYYRLDVAAIRLPPLRERGRDPLLLARRFLERYGRDYGRGALTLSADAAAAIAAFPWPGNVRQLQNAMAHAAALCDGGAVTPDHLPDVLRSARPPAAPASDYRTRVDAHRRDLIADALDRAGGNRSRAARDLGLSRQALLYLIRELRVPVPRGETEPRRGRPILGPPK